MPESFQLQIHLRNDCNLNCKGCAHFIPLSKDHSDLDMDQFQRDIIRMHELFEHEISEIYLFGGEPLLNKNTGKYAEFVRSVFSSSMRIIILSNGKLLSRQSEDFWASMRKAEAEIEFSVYPIGLDYDALVKLCNQHGVKSSYFSDKTGESDWRSVSLTHTPQNRHSNFYYCRWPFNSVNLVNGRLFNCCIAPYVDAFNEYFNETFYLTDADSVDIYSSSRKQIIHYLKRPLPFCRFCGSMHDTNVTKWGLSHREKEEWMASE